VEDFELVTIGQPGRDDPRPKVVDEALPIRPGTDGEHRLEVGVVHVPLELEARGAAAQLGLQRGLAGELVLLGELRGRVKHHVS
jgi:hypothetical protein